MNIFCKKLKYRIKPNFSKDRIRPPHVFFSAFLKKITTTGSSHFLSPNGQGLKQFFLTVGQNNFGNKIPKQHFHNFLGKIIRGCYFNSRQRQSTKEKCHSGCFGGKYDFFNPKSSPTFLTRCQSFAKNR